MSEHLRGVYKADCSTKFICFREGKLIVVIVGEQQERETNLLQVVLASGAVNYEAARTEEWK